VIISRYKAVVFQHELIVQQHQQQQQQQQQQLDLPCALEILPTGDLEFVPEQAGHVLHTSSIWLKLDL